MIQNFKQPASLDHTYSCMLKLKTLIEEYEKQYGSNHQDPQHKSAMLKCIPADVVRQLKLETSLNLNTCSPEELEARIDTLTNLHAVGSPGLGVNIVEQADGQGAAGPGTEAAGQALTGTAPSAEQPTEVETEEWWNDGEAVLAYLAENPYLLALKGKGKGKSKGKRKGKGIGFHGSCFAYGEYGHSQTYSPNSGKAKENVMDKETDGARMARAKEGHPWHLSSTHGTTGGDTTSCRAPARRATCKGVQNLSTISRVVMAAAITRTRTWRRQGPRVTKENVKMVGLSQ